MVDLKSQYAKIESKVDSAIKDVIKNTNFINGPAVKEFAADLEKHLNVKHVIPCGNGTDALQIALMALDLKPGDEVIVPAVSWSTTYFPLQQYGLKVKFVDIDRDTLNIDLSALEQAISHKTKAILVVN